MKQVILILILLITSNQFIEALEITDSAPDITISNWYNKPQSLVQDKDGKSVYLIEFWASWCKPCIPSIKTLNLFKQKYENKGLVVIRITDENKTDTVQFLKDHNIKYSIGFDETGKTMEKYLTNDDGLPTAFIINREGIVVYKGHPMKAEEVLSQVMNGNLDLKTIKNLKALQEEFKTALQDFKIPQACEIAEKILYINPNNYEAMQFSLFAFEKMGQNTAT
jgi:thiol-disulfide isomerase/thioredoxin